MIFNVIYCDPPWNYENNQDNDSARGGCPYPQMTIEDLAALPVESIAARDCAMFMWATWPKLKEAIGLIEAWGFDYKTVAFVWIKLNATGEYVELDADQMSTIEHLFTAPRYHSGQVMAVDHSLIVNGVRSGQGYWTNGNTEIVLFGKCGAPARDARDVKQLVFAPVTHHSHKPEEVRHRINRLMVASPRVELFSTEPHKVDAAGWIHAGYDVDGRHIADALQSLADDSYLSGDNAKVG